MHNLVESQIMAVYDDSGDGILSHQAARRFLNDALKEVDSQISVSDAELDTLIEQLSLEQ